MNVHRWSLAKACESTFSLVPLDQATIPCPLPVTDAMILEASNIVGHSQLSYSQHLHQQHSNVDSQRILKRKNYEDHNINAKDKDDSRENGNDVVGGKDDND